MTAMFNPSYAQASAHYRQLALSSEIESADPHALVVMLYDELLLCIDVLALQSRDGRPLTADPQGHRARAIVLALQSGLDYESGGELAAMLGGLYSALAAELDERLAKPDPLRFSELRAGVQSVAAAWEQVAAS
jgi:flagellar secretion chaperone FliS